MKIKCVNNIWLRCGYQFSASYNVVVSMFLSTDQIIFLSIQQTGVKIQSEANFSLIFYRLFSKSN